MNVPDEDNFRNVSCALNQNYVFFYPQAYVSSSCSTSGACRVTLIAHKPLHLKFTEIKAGPVKLCEKPCQAMYVLFCEDMLKWLPLCKLFSSLQIVFTFIKRMQLLYTYHVLHVVIVCFVLFVLVSFYIGILFVILLDILVYNLLTMNVVKKNIVLI
jgi:hypothetical protein